MELVKKVFKKKEPEVIKVIIPPLKEDYIKRELPKGEIVSFDDEVIDTSSPKNITIFKHNLEVLVIEYKQKGFIDKFMLVREDNYFPIDFRWFPIRKETAIKKTVLPISNILRKEYALEKANLNNNSLAKDIAKALDKVPLDLGFIYTSLDLAVTKHFNINFLAKNKKNDFIIIDKLNNFLENKNGFVLSYEDTFLDVCHGGLDISLEAIILIEKDKYEKFIKDDNFKDLLNKRKVILYTGDKSLAVQMVLTEYKVLPYKVNDFYIKYDDEIKEILDNSLKILAQKNNLLDNLKEKHFTSYIEEYSKDYITSLEKFVIFMQNKFPLYKELFSTFSINEEKEARKVVQEIGVDNLLEAILEYNEITLKNFQEKYESYLKEYMNIKEEDKLLFNKVNFLLRKKYDINLNNKILNKAIYDFYTLPNIEKQKEAALIIVSILEK